MTVKIYLNGNELHSFVPKRIKNAMHQGLLTCVFYFSNGEYFPPFTSSSYEIKYFKEDGSLIQTFSDVSFRDYDIHESIYNDETSELSFIVNKV